MRRGEKSLTNPGYSQIWKAKMITILWRTFRSTVSKNCRVIIIYVISVLSFCGFNGLFCLISPGGFKYIIPFLLLFWSYMILDNLINMPENKFLIGMLFILFPSMVNSAIVTFLLKGIFAFKDKLTNKDTI